MTGTIGVLETRMSRGPQVRYEEAQVLFLFIYLIAYCAFQ